MRLLICAGGTGGGVYPALAVLQALRGKADPVLWVGGTGGMEADLVQRANVPYTSIPAAGLHGVSLRTLPGNLLQLARGLKRSSQVIREFKPDVLFFTGGYVGAPVAIAGRSIPSALFVPDIEPGLALKAIGNFADRIAVTTEDSRRYFNHRERVKVTGYPTRSDLQVWDRRQACDKFGLSIELPVVLVFGGSKGARSINLSVISILPQLLQQAQVLHITGKLDWEKASQAKASLPDEIKHHYHPFDYIYEDMGAAFAAADLAVCRAGASTLGELPLFGLPAILVPYPYAWRYQKVNADYLANRSAAEVIHDESLSESLLPSIKKLLDDPQRLQQMRQNMLSLRRPNAADNIANMLIEMANKPGRQPHA